MNHILESLIKTSNLSKTVVTFVRFYPRWTCRRPAKVFSSKISGPGITTIIDPQNLNDEINESKVEKPPPPHDAKSKQQVLNATSIDEHGNYVYTKMRNNDSKIGQLMLMVKSRKVRNKKELILLEGKRLIRDALLAKCCTLEHLLFSRKSDLGFIKELLPKNAILYKVPYKQLQLWSNLTTSPGIVGIFKKPRENNDERRVVEEATTIPLTIICDNIREAGNLGAILRVCAGVGCRQILLSKGCVDVWEPKVLRSSCGAHFHINIRNALTWEEIRACIPENSTVFLADSNMVASCTIPILPYYSVYFYNYPSVVIVIGGETIGLTEQSYQFAAECDSRLRLNIPLNNNIDSMNSATALAVLIFEIKRQFLLHKAAN